MKAAIEKTGDSGQQEEKMGGREKPDRKGSKVERAPREGGKSAIFAL